MSNLIPNFRRLDIVIDIGKITLGKYTLPKIAWFLIKVFEGISEAILKIIPGCNTS